jgi:hypothetical protein
MDTQTYKLTYTQIFSQYSGISSHSFGRSYICSFMNRGVCLHTESSAKIWLQFWMSSVYVHLEKRQVSQTDFANTLVCMMMKGYTRI